VDTPCLRVEPSDRIDFGAVERGVRASKTLSVTNCSSAEQTTFSAQLEGAETFSIEGERTLATRTLDPGEQAGVTVGLETDRPGISTGRLLVESNDPAQPRRTVELLAGVVDGCPRPVVVASVEGESRAIAAPEAELGLRPGIRVELDASSSVPGSPGGKVESYSWRVTTRPSSSSAALRATSDPAVRQFKADAAGTYEVELDVRDDADRSSCRVANLMVTVAPGAEVYATLEWETPGDSKPENRVGADLDLHLLHPDGVWNRAPWDCYFDNPDPEWQPGDGASEDPELLKDVVDGRFAERLELKRPVRGRTYQLGVYYFSGRGFGTSRATVRVWKEGRRVFVRRGVKLEPGDFWHIAALPWPGDSVQVRDRITKGFPN